MSDMTKTKAENLLGLSGEYDADAVKKAYRSAIKENHPDAVEGDSAKAAATKKMADINEANKYLASMLKTCGGKASTSSAYKATSAPSSGKSNYYANQEYWKKQQEESQKAAQQAESARQWRTTPASTDFSTTPTEEDEPKPKMTPKRFFRKVIEHFPYRIGFIVFAFAWYYLCLGQMPSMFPDVSDIPLGAEQLFAWFGLIIVSFVNLVFGLVTDPAREACLWFVDKLTGDAPKEPSVRFAVFGHLPYRLIFLGVAIWAYWDFASFHVADSGPFDWPLRVLLFGVAALNFVVPILTNPLRSLLAGEP